MSKQIYLLYSCNQWKEWSSMRIVMASASDKKIRKELLNQIKYSKMKYDANLADIKNEELEHINNTLEYGFIMSVKDGEVQ